MTEFTSTNPRPEEIRLLVEISDATRYFDRGTKAGLYARAKIEEYWSLDLVARVLYVHREPREGKYQSVTIYQETDSIAPLAAPQEALLVSALLPPHLLDGSNEVK